MKDLNYKKKITWALSLNEEVPKSQIHINQGNTSEKQNSVPFLLPEESPVTSLENETVPNL